MKWHCQGCHGMCHVCMCISISNLLLIVDYSWCRFSICQAFSLLLEFAPTGRALARAEVNICAKNIGLGGPKSPKWRFVCLFVCVSVPNKFARKFARKFFYFLFFRPEIFPGVFPMIFDLICFLGSSQ